MPPPPAPLPPKITPPVQADGVPATTPEAVKPAHAPGKVVAKAFDFASYKKQFSADNARKPKPLMMLITGRRAAGKCHNPEQTILMFDGSLKEVKDIEIGDLVMGPDSNPRKVLKTFTGTDAFYKVTSTKTQESFLVTQDHKIPIADSNKYDKSMFLKTAKEIYDNEALRKRASEGNAYIFKVGVIHFPTTYGEPEDYELNPYWLGLWLGDGTSSSTSITKPDTEIIDWCKAYYTELGYEMHMHCNSSGIPTFSPRRVIKRLDERGRVTKYESSYFKVALESLGILNNKHIPKKFLIGSYKARQMLLAGLLDTDGYRHPARKAVSYEFCTKFPALADDFQFLCSSLGLRCTRAEKKVAINGTERLYYRFYIAGENLLDTPCLVERKKPGAEYICRTDSSHHGFNIEPVGEMPYAGIECDEDSLYVMGNFFLTHNSSCMGSCPGDLLLFCSRAEHHSFSAAQSIAQMIGNPHAIIPMWIDLDDEERVIDNPERVWTRMADRLDQLIAMPDVASMFPFIAVDSLNSFEKFTLKRDNVLKANQFQKSQEATSNLLELVVDKLLRLRERGCHILVTMAAEVKERADGSMQLTPFLTGYRAAEEVIGSFPDICLAHCVTEVDEEKNEYQERFVFQFRNAEGSKSGKRFSGEVSTSTFNPRLQSIPRPYLPEYADANIGTLIQFINDTFEQMNSSSAT